MDFSRWLIAWVQHNPSAKDQTWSLMECAKNMGGKITEAQASDITTDLRQQGWRQGLPSEASPRRKQEDFRLRRRRLRLVSI